MMGAEVGMLVGGDAVESHYLFGEGAGVGAVSGPGV